MSTIIIKGIIDEDFVNYKKPSMTIMFPKCSFKCAADICQNVDLINMPDISIDVDQLCERYLDNPIPHSLCFQGLEPLDSYKDMILIIDTLRKKYECDDDIVIYTGYSWKDIKNKVKELATYKNIIIKYGGYIPDQKPHHDEVLGIKLASDNQYAERIS